MPLTEVTESGCAYLKAGFYGAQGSGKTRTAVELATELHAFIKSTKPIAIVDSEGGSDFVVPLIRDRGIRVVVDKTRAFADLKADMQEAVHKCDIMLVDSVSHYWRELLSGYQKDKRLRFMRIQDWGPVKSMWEQGYTRPYLDLPVHIIMCGRSANIFEDVEDDEAQPGAQGSGQWKAVKTGTKMSAEGETGYEPHLLVEMERIYTEGSGVYARRATVVKERYGVLDGRVFEFADKDKRGYVFKCFLPHIKLLALGKEHRQISDQTSEGLFSAPDPQNGHVLQTRRQIALETIEATVIEFIPGHGPKDKQLKSLLFEAVFGTRSWTQIQGWPPDQLNERLPVLRYVLGRCLEQPFEPSDGPSAILEVLVRWREEILESLAVMAAERRETEARAAQENHQEPSDGPAATIEEAPPVEPQKAKPQKGKAQAPPVEREPGDEQGSLL